jgi:hypothetical protein
VQAGNSSGSSSQEHILRQPLGQGISQHELPSWAGSADHHQASSATT